MSGLEGHVQFCGFYWDDLSAIAAAYHISPHVAGEIYRSDGILSGTIANDFFNDASAISAQPISNLSFS